MSTEEAERTISTLRTEVEELRARVSDLELRAAGGHNCLLDICDLDAVGRCRLRPCEHCQEDS